MPWGPKERLGLLKQSGPRFTGPPAGEAQAATRAAGKSVLISHPTAAVPVVTQLGGRSQPPGTGSGTVTPSKELQVTLRLVLGLNGMVVYLNLSKSPSEYIHVNCVFLK